MVLLRRVSTTTECRDQCCFSLTGVHSGYLRGVRWRCHGGCHRPRSVRTSAVPLSLARSLNYCDESDGHTVKVLVSHIALEWMFYAFRPRL